MTVMATTNDQVAGVYYTTTDYRKFNKLLGNRAVTEKRVNAITDSMKRRGYIKNPIIVNDRFEVIDGQGRLAALETLGLPVEYILVPGLTIEDCISMNVQMKNWGPADYVDSYADRGEPNYIALRDLMREFPTLNFSVLGGLARDNVGYGASAPSIREGKFKFIADPVEVRNTLNFIVKIQGRTKGISGTRRIMALAFCYRLPGVKPDRLEKVIVQEQKNISIPSRSQDVVRAIQDAYNKGLGAKSMVSMELEYERACRSNCPNYEKMHGDKRREGQS